MFNLEIILNQAKKFAIENQYLLETKGLEQGGKVLGITFIDNTTDTNTDIAFVYYIEENLSREMLLVNCYTNGHIEDFAYFDSVEKAIAWTFGK